MHGFLKSIIPSHSFLYLARNFFDGISRENGEVYALDRRPKDVVPFVHQCEPCLQVLFRYVAGISVSVWYRRFLFLSCPAAFHPFFRLLHFVHLRIVLVFAVPSCLEPIEASFISQQCLYAFARFFAASWPGTDVAADQGTVFAVVLYVSRSEHTWVVQSDAARPGADGTSERYHPSGPLYRAASGHTLSATDAAGIQLPLYYLGLLFFATPYRELFYTKLLTGQ